MNAELENAPGKFKCTNTFSQALKISFPAPYPTDGTKKHKTIPALEVIFSPSLAFLKDVKPFQCAFKNSSALWGACRSRAWRRSFWGHVWVTGVRGQQR